MILSPHISVLYKGSISEKLIPFILLSGIFTIETRLRIGLYVGLEGESFFKLKG